MADAQSERFIFSGSQSSGNWDIVRLKEDGSSLTQLTTGPANEFGYDVSPDGLSMVYNSDASGVHQVYKMNLLTMAVQQLTFEGENMFPRYSPNGSKILMTRAASMGALADLYTMDTDGSNVIDLTNDPGLHEAQGEWSPDGSKIVFSKGTPNGGVNLWTMDSSGGGLFQVTSMGWDEWQPTWSPDGSQIAFHGLQGNWDIMRVNADGSDLTRLTEDGGADQGPGWTPEGQILFTSQRHHDSIFRMNSDGTGVTLIKEGFFTAPRLEIVAVPEPGSLAALLLGTLFIGASIRRKARSGETANE